MGILSFLHCLTREADNSHSTRMLQPSLSGDALISVICTVSPSALNLAESLSTLAFAQGLKRVLLKAQKKEVVDPQALIQQYQGEIAELKALLREKQGYSGSGETPGRSGEVSPAVSSAEQVPADEYGRDRRTKPWKRG